MNLLLVFLYAAGSVVCHQRPERSFFWDGVQFPVCARCTGLYLGGVAGLLVWWGVRWARRTRVVPLSPPKALRALVIAAIPTAISWTSGALGLWDGANLTRALLALPLGMAVGVVVAAVGTKDLR